MLRTVRESFAVRRIDPAAPTRTPPGRSKAVVLMSRADAGLPLFRAGDVTESDVPNGPSKAWANRDEREIVRRLELK